MASGSTLRQLCTPSRTECPSFTKPAPRSPPESVAHGVPQNYKAMPPIGKMIRFLSPHPWAKPNQSESSPGLSCLSLLIALISPSHHPKSAATTRPRIPTTMVAAPDSPSTIADGATSPYSLLSQPPPARSTHGEKARSRGGRQSRGPSSAVRRRCASGRPRGMGGATRSSFPCWSC